MLGDSAERSLQRPFCGTEGFCLLLLTVLLINHKRPPGVQKRVAFWPSGLALLVAPCMPPCPSESSQMESPPLGVGMVCACELYYRSHVASADLKLNCDFKDDLELTTTQVLRLLMFTTVPGISFKGSLIFILYV